MTRAILLTAVVLAAGCASGGGGQPDETLTGADWIPGSYLLEARIPRMVGGRADNVEHRADLVISADGTMRLTSQTDGICQDPSPAEVGADRQRGQRTFLCGDSRYEIRPGARMPAGNVRAVVEDERLVEFCVRFERRPDGSQVCVQTDTRIETEKVAKSARLQVLRIGA